MFSNKGVFCLMLGSGISRPSGIPTGWEITLELVKRLALLRKEETGSDPAAWYREAFGKEPDYSDLLEALSLTPEERINIFRPFMEPTPEEFEQGVKQPTKAHRAIAALAGKGYIKVIVTTNFDRLMETALRKAGIEPSVIANPAHIEHAVPLIHSKVTVIKIHGDYLDIRFLNIKSELAAYDDRIYEFARFVFENFGLVTAGWSAKWDYALAGMLKSSCKFRYGNYFTFVHPCSTKLAELASFRKAKLVNIKDADAFFTELLENVEALERGRQHPLSKEIAVERVKKYLVREEFQIELHDLVTSLTEDLTKKLGEGLDVSSPDKQKIKQRIDKYLADCTLLEEVLANGVYWGKEIHHQLWLNTLLRVSYPANDNPSYAVWSGIVLLPSLLLLYTAGLAAVISNNLSFLYRLLTIKKYTDYSPGSELLIEHTNPGRVLDRRIAQESLGTKNELPLSGLLHETLLPVFAKIVTNAKSMMMPSIILRSYWR